MNSFFITGTGTDVGKTVLAATLLRGLHQRDLDAVPMKPVQTGCVEGPTGMTAPDLDLCLAVCGYAPRADEYAILSPYRFAPPCSPHLAVKGTDQVIQPATIIDALRALQEHHDTVLVEGAGGVLVPLGPDLLTIDLIQELSLPVIIAARPGLGTLNHTLLTLEVLRHRDIPVQAVVMVAEREGPADAIERDNFTTIEKMGCVPVHGPIPYLPKLAQGTIDGEEFDTIAVPAVSRLLDELV
jgi:dethiobiotin synthetase